MQEESLLTGMVRKELGGNAFDNISTIYKNGSAYIAGFAQLVIRAAQSGDATARQILRNNAQRLALLIQKAVSENGRPEQIIATGSFMRHESFRVLVEQLAEIKLTPPELPPVYGACVEALRAEGLQTRESFLQNFADSYKMIAF